MIGRDDRNLFGTKIADMPRHGKINGCSGAFWCPSFKRHMDANGEMNLDVGATIIIVE